VRRSTSGSRGSVRQRVRGILGAEIQTGELEAGQIYSAVALSESMGVSATPVREALMDLANAGLVEAVRNVGFRVRTISATDLDEILALRRWLEVPAMDLVIRAATDDDLTALRPLAERICEEATRNDVTGFALADSVFHAAVLDLTRSPRLVKVVGELRGQTHLLGLRRLGAAHDLVPSGLEHIEIVEALVARDRRLARALMRRHLEHAREIWAGVKDGSPGRIARSGRAERGGTIPSRLIPVARDADRPQESP
jgi:DNA-binding GntR family transcriptional regulator